MSRTESMMVQLGTLAPAFQLFDVVSGKAMSRDDVFKLSCGDKSSNHVHAAPRGGAKKRGLLIMFLCVHCPYVKHIEEELARIGMDYLAEDGRGPIAIAAIQSNDIAQYPADGTEHMRTQALRLGWRFPYFLDEKQEVAKAYEAACTPDFFLFDGELQLVYRGQLDDSRPQRKDSGNDLAVTGKDLRGAMDAVIAGKKPATQQRSSIGCNIKWRES